MEIKQLRLNSLENSRKSFSRIINAFNKGDLPETKFKGLVYSLSHYIHYWKLIRDDELIKRVDDLEVRINEHNQKN